VDDQRLTGKADHSATALAGQPDGGYRVRIRLEYRARFPDRIGDWQVSEKAEQAAAPPRRVSGSPFSASVDKDVYGPVA
jgi:hypothetical protein